MRPQLFDQVARITQDVVKNGFAGWITCNECFEPGFSFFMIQSAHVNLMMFQKFPESLVIEIDEFAAYISAYVLAVRYELAFHVLSQIIQLPA
jgi:hypothetical protein